MSWLRGSIGFLSRLAIALSVPAILVLLFSWGVFYQIDRSLLEYLQMFATVSTAGYYVQVLSNIFMVAMCWAIIRKFVMYFWFDTVLRAKQLRIAQKQHVDIKADLLFRLSRRIRSAEIVFNKMKLKIFQPIRLFGVSCLVCLVLLPVFPSQASPSDDIKQTFTNIQSDIVQLVAGDWSLGLVELFMGDIIPLVKRDPFSFDLLDTISDAGVNGTTFLEAIEDGLDISFFSQTEPDPDAVAAQPASLVSPDSFLGYMSFFLSLTFMLLLLLAMIFRVFATVTLAGTMKDKQTVIRLFGQAFSGILSLGVTAPIYKGFNILGIYLVSCIVTGVGIANFAVILYFKFALAGSIAPPSFNPQSEKIWNQLVDRYVCVFASDQSTGGHTAVSARKNREGGRQIIVDFGPKCGSFTIEDGVLLDKPIKGYSGLDPENISDMKILLAQEALEKFLDNVKDMILDAKEYAAHIMLLKKELLSNAELIANQFEVDVDVSQILDDCRMYISNPSDDSDYATRLTSDMKSICSQNNISSSEALKKYLSGRSAFETKSANIIREVVSKLEAYFAGKNIKMADGSDLSTKTLRNSLDDTEVDNPVTWKTYEAGWFKYPVYVASSRSYGKAITSILSMKVEGEPFDPGWFTSGEDQDVMDALVLNQLIKERIGEYEKAIADPMAVIEKMESGGDSMIEASTQLNSVVSTLDSDSVQLLLKWIAGMIIVDQGENIVTSLTDAGHFLVSNYLIFTSINSMKSSLVSGKSSLGKVKDSAEGVGSEIIKGVNIAAPWFGATLGMITGMTQPYWDLITMIMPNLFITGLVLAFGVPALVFYFFMIALLKWFTQVLKTSIFVAASPLKLYDSEGSQFVGKGMSSILLMCIVIGASPTIIVGSFMSIENGMTGIIGMLQALWYEFMMVSSAPYVMGLGALIVSVMGLVAIPFIVMFWMYSFPIAIQEALPRFLDLNLSSHAPNEGVSPAVWAFGLARRGGPQNPMSTFMDDMSKKKNAANESGGQNNENSKASTPRSGSNQSKSAEKPITRVVRSLPKGKV